MLRLFLVLFLLGGCVSVTHNHPAVDVREAFVPALKSVIVEPTVAYLPDGKIKHYADFDKKLIENLRGSGLFAAVGRDVSRPDYRLSAAYRVQEKEQFGNLKLTVWTFGLVPHWESYDIVYDVTLTELRSGRKVFAREYRENIFNVEHLVLFPFLLFGSYEIEKRDRLETNIVSNVGADTIYGVYPDDFRSGGK